MAEQETQLTIPVTGREDNPLPEITSIISLAKEHIPKMKSASEQAVAMMAEVPDEITDEGLEDAMDIAGAIAEGYDKIVARRMTMTKPLDDLKKLFMEYERPLDAKNENSEYAKLRHKIGAYKQKKIDEKKRTEEAAAKRKAKENHLVDIGTSVLQKLNDLMLTLTNETEALSKNYFEKSTLEDFDKRAEQYHKMKPVLKTDRYSACFIYDFNSNLITKEEFADIIATLKSVETYDKWNAELVKNATPVVNAWRAKIPELKENLIKLKNAADETERARLASEQAAKAKEEETRRLSEIQQQHVSNSLEIESNASVNKLSNEFVEQATTQQVGPTGPTKLVLKFTDPKLTLKAFSTIVYHVMADKEFPGIQKKSKDGKLVVDANGNPEYIAAVQWWVDYFLKNCDAAVDGTVVEEIAKVIVKK